MAEVLEVEEQLEESPQTNGDEDASEEASPTKKRQKRKRGETDVEPEENVQGPDVVWFVCCVV